MIESLCRSSIPEEKNIKSQTPEMSSALQRLSFMDKMVDSLPPEQRNVIRMKFWLDLDVDTIALNLRMKKSSVEAHISEAISGLRQELIKKLVEAEPRWEFQEVALG